MVDWGWGFGFPLFLSLRNLMSNATDFPQWQGKCHPNWVMEFGHNIKFIHTLVTLVYGKSTRGRSFTRMRTPQGRAKHMPNSHKTQPLSPPPGFAQHQIKTTVILVKKIPMIPGR
jgi:hypothetical protein